MGRGLQGRAKQVRLGGGSACPGERLEPAVELVEKGNIDYIIFDSLSESEMLAFERQKMRQPDAGYDIYSERRLRAIWAQCARAGIGIIGNMGAANPRGAQEVAIRVARTMGLEGQKVAEGREEHLFVREGSRRNAKNTFCLSSVGQELKVVEKCILGSSWNQIE